ncbi:LamG-like jellyroll fold domain-containing protein [uncultured Lacinutrix sp.]|uniref:LamG-like jellyroll fold domain-containing protein n=1 Tax=uncultured Lacinutrix sp. TaxID=574032 RepID=UPI0026076441|nr:LamG-like jellyroll fold domain-containing protein [uncultured Lacinutrix sp.]
MKRLLFLITILFTSFFAQAQFSEPTNVGFDFYSDGPKFDFADVDGDNDLDIIIASNNILTGLDHTDLYRNDGTGFFVKDVSVSSALIDSKDGSISFADIDGDLDQDVLITGITSSGLEITMYRNDGTGIFTIDVVQSANLVAVNYSTIKFADIDGDTDLDLAIMGEDSTGTILSKIYTNDGTGNFTEDTINSAIIYDVSDGDMDFADVDGDTDLDLLISGYNNEASTYLYLNDGSGNFTEDSVASSTIQDYGAGASVFVDIDGDTDLDLVIGGAVGSSSSTKMYTNNGAGVFTSVSSSFSNYIYYGDIAVSDVDLDGDLDVFISGTIAPTTSVHQTNLYKNDGSGNFTLDTAQSSIFFSGYNSNVMFADLNNDGNEELAISNQNTILIYKNNSLPPIPEINIKGNNIDIISGDTTADIADDTDFETLCQGDSKTNTYTIQNLGGANLEVTSITLSGIGAGDYAINGIILPLTINSLASSTFDVTFTPSADGDRTATITVNNDDPDENVYTFDITGKRQSDIVVTAATGTFECSGGSDSINTSLSEVGLYYYLRNDADNNIVDGPITGTGNGLTFDTGVLTEDTTFNIFSTSTLIRGLEFDGVNDFIQISGGQLHAPNAITLESWVKFDALGQRKPIISKSASQPTQEPFYEYELEVRTNGEVYFAIAVNGTRKVLQTTGVSLTPNTWAHIASTWDGTDMRVFINGVAYGATTPALGTMNSYNTPVRLGSLWQPPLYSQVTLDDVRIWDVARTASQILNYKDTELNGNESGLIGYYKLNDGAGTNANDSSTSNNDGTLFNMGAQSWVNGTVGIGTNSSFCQLGEVENTVTIIGVNCAPEINITGNNLDILNGDNTPIVADGTDFETQCIGNSKTNTFTIENTGSDDLEIISIVLSGVNSEDYTINGITLPLILNKLTATTFDITFTSTASGVRSATITINNNDVDESAYTFNVTGEEFPEITVSATTGTYACAGGNDMINTSSSEIGLEYVLRNDADDSIVDGPIAGTGNGLAFDTGFLTEDTTFNIFSSPILIETNGLKFDGVDESIEIPNDVSLNPTNAITLESWVKFDGLGDRKPVIYKPPTSASSEPFYQYEFEIRDDGEVYFALSINGSRKTLRTTGTSLPVDTWSHVACTWDGSTMRIYINGVAYTNTTSASGTLSTYATNVRLGSHVNTNFGEMELDDVRIWEVARTATEILNAKDIELVGNEVGLVAYYTLNDNTGNIANDSSMNNNNGNLLNMEFEDWITGIVSAEGSSSDLCSIGELANTITIVRTCTILLSPKVYLQGAALNPNAGEEILMRDDLRAIGMLPTTSPYIDALTCDATVFNVTGDHAIVDWIWVELRDKNTNTSVLHSTSALLQRDGNVVGVDGISPLSFNTSSLDDFYVTIKHFNHLGIMSLNTVYLSETTTIVDFTDANNQITYGTDAQTIFGMPNGVVAMWSGDANGDGRLNYSGSQSDIPIIRSQVFNDPNNSVFGGPPVASYPSQGYNHTDVDMNGVSVYSGAASDVLNIRNNIFNNPSNSVFGGPPTSTYLFIQQLPEGANN